MQKARLYFIHCCSDECLSEDVSVAFGSLPVFPLGFVHLDLIYGQVQRSLSKGSKSGRKCEQSGDAVSKLGVTKHILNVGDLGPEVRVAWYAVARFVSYGTALRKTHAL